MFQLYYFPVTYRLEYYFAGRIFYIYSPSVQGVNSISWFIEIHKIGKKINPLF